MRKDRNQEGRRRAQLLWEGESQPGGPGPSSPQTLCAFPQPLLLPNFLKASMLSYFL